ncbi:unnamed protein product [Lepeophtheirus salmonis]|uniref:(salmon louse) hypothetical protein n=1 Tax=Lepeophtheirus salmonis TaxID=72036 RepID=A0A817F9W0_LEPSM|nr:unnamed protein product [Lepeophtheirus salmonis]CAG9476081.1 unnamed protein product [Lepeophtheirus salmonis]
MLPFVEHEYTLAVEYSDDVHLFITRGDLKVWFKWQKDESNGMSERASTSHKVCPRYLHLAVLLRDRMCENIDIHCYFAVITTTKCHSYGIYTTTPGGSF